MGSVSSVKDVETLVGTIDYGPLKLTEVYLAPDSRHNIISELVMLDHGYDVKKTRDLAIVTAGSFVCTRIMCLDIISWSCIGRKYAEYFLV